MIIVTGAAGFIGSAFIAKLNSAGVSDILAVDDLGCSEKWRNLVGKSFREYLHKDRLLELISSNTLPSALQAVVHLGAISSTTERDIEGLIRNNVEYSKTLARFALDRGIRFIYASSAATYGDGSEGYEDDESLLLKLRPLNGYGFSKHLFDLWATREGVLTHAVGLKFFNVYGPNEYYKGDQASVVWKAFNAIEQNGSFGLFKSYRAEYGDGEQKRDFVYVKDCCEVVSWLLNHPKACGLVNVGSGRARSWNELLRSLFAALGKEPRIDYVDMPEALRAQYQYFTEAPISKLRRLGFNTPFCTIEEGVGDYVRQHLRKTNPHY